MYTNIRLLYKHLALVPTFFSLSMPGYWQWLHVHVPVA